LEKTRSRINYQKELDRLLSGIRAEIQEKGKAPRLFLHSCCAPCSSYVLEYLGSFFQITDFFYNPNISPEEEYHLREAELQRLITELQTAYPVTFLAGTYDPKLFYRTVQGLEELPEGGERCFLCYRLRMEEAAKLAAEGDFDYFTTTLSISPLKNAEKINEIGQELEKIYGVRHLPSDFKKRNGYLRSIELSKEHDLYRQDYCGCVFSKRQREREKEQGSGKD
jgi:predicted adenine nucleotide alpha hydrolase (AANH) superfamily ATPase